VTNSFRVPERTGIKKRSIQNFVRFHEAVFKDTDRHPTKMEFYHLGIEGGVITREQRSLRYLKWYGKLP
jgi:hypothetical protein